MNTAELSQRASPDQHLVSRRSMVGPRLHRQRRISRIPSRARNLPRAPLTDPSNQTITRKEHQHHRRLALHARRVSSNTGRHHPHHLWIAHINHLARRGLPTSHGLNRSMAKRGATVPIRITMLTVVHKSARDLILMSTIIRTAQRSIAIHCHHLHPIKGCILQKLTADRANQNREALLNHTHGKAHCIRMDVLTKRLLTVHTLNQSVTNW